MTDETDAGGAVREMGRPGGSRGALVALIALAVAAAAGIAVMMALGKKPPETGRIAEMAIAVQTLKVAPKQLPDEVTIPGLIEPIEQARISAEAPGRISEVPVKKGDKVAAGQLLLKIDSRSAEAMVKQAEIQHREGTNELRRLTELKAKGAVSDSDFENAKKMTDLAAVALADARVRLSQCEMKSPIAGVVNDRTIELGEYASPGLPAFHIVNVESVKVVSNVPERDIPFVRGGVEMSFMVEALPGRLFKGKVSFVAAAGSKQSNTFVTEIVTENQDQALKPGMIARVVLSRSAARDVIVVPLTAIVPVKGDHVVFVVETGAANGKAIAARRLVKIERINGSEATISDGVKAGETIVVDGARSLMDGMPVKLVAQGSSGSGMPDGKDVKE